MLKNPPCSKIYQTAIDFDKVFALSLDKAEENLPKVSGVVIVCSGANNISVRLELQKAICALLDVTEEKIEILKAIDYYSNNKGSNKILIKIKNFLNL